MTDKLTFATQGGYYSYHAEAARKASNDNEVGIEPKDRFGDVVRASRSLWPGLGVIAISTASGTVDDSAAEIVRKRPSALPPVVARVDVEVLLALIGSSDQSIDELNRRRVRCLGQKAATIQCNDYLDDNLPWIKRQYKHESTQAIQEVLNAQSKDMVAIGPAHAAEKMGGFILGPNQINPEGSITSFYILQRDPRLQILPLIPEHTAPRTVISLAIPEGNGEFNKCVELAEELDVEVARFIRFDIGDFTKHDDGRKRGGGILEINHDRYDENVTEFCARINGIEANDGRRGPFTTKVLGDYMWLPEQPIDLSSIVYE